MRKEQKSQLIDSLCEEIKAYPHLYIADIGGLNSVQTSKLRRAAFRKEVKMIVVKNTLLIKAMEKSGIDYSELFPVIKGETSIMLANINNAPAKLIKEFRANNSKETNKPILKGAYVEESFYIGDENLDTLVNIKSKNELIADVIALLQSPVKNVLSSLQSAGNTICGVLETLSERAE
ncbi:MAG: 50S ribosomal protein L10 [Bacteroidales bacterium]|nr:50S ribosomal protein L10 [Bacteroidales bacterium]MBR1643932.1 50S ribosomal protein L10 [Bacteroidales bacterium]